MYPTVHPNCTRRHQAPASLALVFWPCPRGGHITVRSSIHVHTFVKRRLITAIFGVEHTNSRISKSQSQLIAFSTLLARRLILTNWRVPSPPPKHSRWVLGIVSFIQLDALIQIPGSRMNLSSFLPCSLLLFFSFFNLSDVSVLF